MLWALEDAPITEPGALLVLIALAEHADEHGRNAFPSVRRLAARARCSERTVQRHLRALKDARLIRDGDQSIVARYRADQRPSVLDLNLAAVRDQAAERGDNMSPREDDGVTPVSPGTSQRGDKPGTNGVTPVSPKPSTEPSTEDQDLKTCPTSPDVTLSPPPKIATLDPAEFVLFWRVYPRKTAKVTARTAWARARKTATGEEIINGAERYRDDPNREDAYTAHPATWLHAGRWDDEPLPVKLDRAGRERQATLGMRETWTRQAAILDQANDPWKALGQ